jgi:hypothetical protein
VPCSRESRGFAVLERSGANSSFDEWSRVDSRERTVDAVRPALEAAGVEFTTASSRA